MNELELFMEWFKGQNYYSIVHSKDNYNGSALISEVLKAYNRKRDDLIIECIITQELRDKEDYNEKHALALAKSIMSKIKKLDKEAY